jgi:hypothetical protein
MAILVLSAISASLPSIMAGEGNILPSGKHFTLNILGKKWNKGNAAEESPLDPSGEPNPDYNPVVKTDSGHRIFVKLGSAETTLKTRIGLREGDDFAVLDADGTDGKALFQLPDPGDVINPDTGEYDPSNPVIPFTIKDKKSGYCAIPKGKTRMFQESINLSLKCALLTSPMFIDS